MAVPTLSSQPTEEPSVRSESCREGQSAEGIMKELGAALESRREEMKSSAEICLGSTLGFRKCSALAVCLCSALEEAEPRGKTAQTF